MKRLLILSTRLPYPLIDGVRIRIYNTAKYLSREFEVDLLCLSTEPHSEGDLEALRRVFGSVEVISASPLRCAARCMRSLWNGLPLQVNYFHDPRFARRVRERAAEYDLVICNHTRTAEFMRRIIQPTRCIVDLHDAFSMRYERTMDRVRWPMRAGVRFEFQKVLAYEQSIVREFDRTLIVSDVDRQYIVSHGAPAEKLETLNVAVRDDIRIDGAADAGGRTVSFLGKMSYAPNEDAVLWFADEVFPLLRRTDPDLGFTILGATPSNRVRQLERRGGIRVTGFLENPYNLLDASAVVVAPIRYGAGLQNKILEAMFLGKVVVTTSVGAEGIAGADGEHFLLADTPDAFAAQVSRLLGDETLRRRIGDNARALIDRRYTWEALSRRYIEIVREVLALPGRTEAGARG